MTTTSNSFSNWLRQQILQNLNKNTSPPPFIIWCDPYRVWKDLLQTVANEGGFELWADETHELILREKFYKFPRSPRVVWLPVSRGEITYFKVFESQAEEVKEVSLLSALSDYGVEIPSEQIPDLEPLLPAHVKEWFNYPLEHWKDNLSKGQLKTSLIDDDLFLQILASYGKPLDTFITDDRISVFNRRAIEDYGLPPLFDNKLKNNNLGVLDIDQWRIQAAAFLLVTDAMVKSPENPPTDKDRIIPQGASRERALKLLSRWQKQIDLVGNFEKLAIEADKITTLQYWAKSCKKLSRPFASYVVENILFQKEIEYLDSLDTFEVLARYLDEKITDYQTHAHGFWGKDAHSKIPWWYLVDMAKIASLLHQQTRIETAWKSPADAVTWFTRIGWQVDHAGEVLFCENTEMPGGLAGIRTTIRKAYLRHLDRINLAFSELLSHAGVTSLNLPFAGDVIKDSVEKASSKEPVAVLVLDACRYDLGCRLAELLNHGEPAPRAVICQAIAPIPSITALGMPFTLPGLSSHLNVELHISKDMPWSVTTEGFSGNLSIAENRQKWLKKKHKLKDHAMRTIENVLNPETANIISVKSLGKLVFVFGDDFDDHDEKLKPLGLDQILERYARVVRRLRSAGYTKVFVVTDHGFFHWEPETDEVQPKPIGEILWTSRRAVVGHNLKHPTAISCKATGSALDCTIPRSINAFKTYGGLGFFHGGATLQELIIPVVTVQWPKKAQKIGVVLKPVTQIVSLAQKIEVAPAAIRRNLLGGVDENLLSRQASAKIQDPVTGKLIFKAKNSISLDPDGGSKTLELIKVEGAEAKMGSKLDIVLFDADDEEILDRNSVILQVELDEWF